MGPYVTGHMFKDSFPWFFVGPWLACSKSDLSSVITVAKQLPLPKQRQSDWHQGHKAHSRLYLFTPLNLEKNAMAFGENVNLQLGIPTKPSLYVRNPMGLLAAPMACKAQSVLYQIFDLVSQPSTRLAVVVRKPGDGSVVMVETGAWQKIANNTCNKKMQRIQFCILGTAFVAPVTRICLRWCFTWCIYIICIHMYQIAILGNMCSFFQASSTSQIIIIVYLWRASPHGSKSRYI